jgi:uncharacterized protein YdhG (YjbR/CyaY superfamily)
MHSFRPKSVDEYIAAQDVAIQFLLLQIRSTIQKAAPLAEEKISYNMPSFALNGVLVFYAAFKNHIGFYPTASGITQFKEEISAYNNSKGAIQFPFDRPLPLQLIAKIVRFRVNENLAKPKKRNSSAK